MTRYRIKSEYSVTPDGTPATVYVVQYRLWGSWLTAPEAEPRYDRDKAQADLNWLKGQEDKRIKARRERRRQVISGWMGRR